MDNAQASDDSVDLLHPSVQKDPFLIYKNLRNNRPVCQLRQRGMLAISRYRDVVYALRKPDIFSSTGVADTLLPQWLDSAIEHKNYIIALEDNPQHNLHKKLITKTFSHNAIESLTPHMKACAEHLLANLTDNTPIEFISTVAYPYVESNINCFIGIDDEEKYPHLREWSQLSDLPPAEYDVGYLEELNRYNSEVTAYCEKLVRSRRQNRRKDFISALLDADPDNQVLIEENKSDLLEILFRAGLLPTAHLLAHAILRLSQDSTLIQQLKSQPEKIRAFIDELLRYDTPGHFLPRRTKSDVTVSGVVIPKNTKVFLLLGSANRDPDHFAHPEIFDISRPNNKTHVALGYGIHRCMGEILLRAQITSFLEVLLCRFSAITCPPAEQLDWIYTLSVYSVKELPVNFSQ